MIRTLGSRKFNGNEQGVLIVSVGGAGHILILC